MEITQQMSKYQREIQRFFGEKKEKVLFENLDNWPFNTISGSSVARTWALLMMEKRFETRTFSELCKQCSTTIGSKQTFLTWSNCPIGTMHPKLMTTKGMSPLWPGGRRGSKYNTQFLFWNKRREVSRDVKVRFLQINNCAYFMTMEGNEDHLNLLERRSTYMNSSYPRFTTPSSANNL